MKQNLSDSKGSRPGRDTATYFLFGGAVLIAFAGGAIVSGPLFQKQNWFEASPAQLAAMQSGSTNKEVAALTSDVAALRKQKVTLAQAVAEAEKSLSERKVALLSLEAKQKQAESDAALAKKSQEQAAGEIAALELKRKELASAVEKLSAEKLALIKRNSEAQAGLAQAVDAPRRAADKPVAENPVPNPRAFRGTVQLVDGKNYDGDIRWDKDAFAVTRPDGSWKRLQFEQLSLLRTQEKVQPAALENATPHGLRGSYFKNRELNGPAVVRVDAAIDFDWKEGSPMREIPPDNFSARWEGLIEAPANGKFTFYTESNDGVRLWVNNQKIIDQWSEHHTLEHKGALELKAGKKYPLKMEFYEHGGTAVARLSWSGPDVARAVVPSSRLTPSEAGEFAQRLHGDPAGVVLAGGSFIAGRVRSADERSLQLADATVEAAIPLANVARICFQPAEPEQENKLQTKKAGVLLRNGEFIEGHFKGFAQGKVSMQTTQSGAKSYEQEQVWAVVLREAKSRNARFELRTRSDSRILAHNIWAEKGGLAIQDTTIAKLEVPAAEVTEIRKAR